MATGYSGLAEPPPPLQRPATTVGAIPGWTANLVQWLWELHRWLISGKLVINNILSGKLNATGDITLTAASTTTTLTDARITSNSFLDFMPTTANAANAKTTLYVSARTKGSATLTHATDATTDRIFRYLIIG